MCYAVCDAVCDVVCDVVCGGEGSGKAHYRRLAKLNSNYGAGCMLAVFTSCQCRHYICLNAADCRLHIFVFRQSSVVCCDSFKMSLLNNIGTILHF